jgi:hypothetical protein
MTQQKLMHSYKNNGKFIGNFYYKSLDQLKTMALKYNKHFGTVKCENISGDVSKLHLLPKYNGALFQATSQFNLLEFSNPNRVPENGITIYQYDRTQGPMCDISCPSTTAWRNYLIPMPNNQINTLENIEIFLSGYGRNGGINVGRNGGRNGRRY